MNIIKEIANKFKRKINKDIVIEDSAWQKDPNYTPDKCPFCYYSSVSSGSWAPENCPECGAVYFMGWWFLE